MEISVALNSQNVSLTHFSSDWLIYENSFFNEISCGMNILYLEKMTEMRFLNFVPPEIK